MTASKSVMTLGLSGLLLTAGLSSQTAHAVEVSGDITIVCLCWLQPGLDR